MQTLTRTRWAALAWLLTALLPAAEAAATLDFRTEVSLSQGLITNCRDVSSGPSPASILGCEIPALPPQSVPVDPVTGDMFDPVFGSASAGGNHGALSTRAVLSSSDSDHRAYHSYALASATDTLMIDSPGLTGTLVGVQFVFDVSAFGGVNQPSGLGNLVFDNDIRLLLETDADWGHPNNQSQFRIADITTAMGPAFPGESTVEERVFNFTIRLGDPFSFTTESYSRVACGQACTGAWSGTADASNTVVLNVVTSSSIPLQAYSLDGNRYANVTALPEPTDILLLATAAGVGLLAWGRAGRASSR